MATSYTHYAGDSAVIQVTVADSDGDAVSLSGSSFVYRIYSANGDTALVTKSTAAGITVSGAVVSITLTPADTSTLVGVYRHTLVETTASNAVYTLLSDFIVVQVA